MSISPLQICLNQHLSQAMLSLRLDNELGIFHGMAWTDFVLLNILDEASGALTASNLAQILCVPQSRLLVQLLPLEKTGLVVRDHSADGVRHVCLRPNGKKLICEARETAARLCEEFLAC